MGLGSIIILRSAASRGTSRPCTYICSHARQQLSTHIVTHIMHAIADVEWLAHTPCRVVSIPVIGVKYATVGCDILAHSCMAGCMGVRFSKNFCDSDVQANQVQPMCMGMPLV